MQEMNPNIRFKHEKDIELFNYVNPMLYHVADDMAIWCEENKLPFVITATVTTKEEDRKLNRISDSHNEKRAIDVSIRGWNKLQMGLFEGHFCEVYKHIASISKSDGIARMVALHGEGDNLHFHIALHSKYKVVESKK